MSRYRSFADITRDESRAQRPGRKPGVNNFDIGNAPQRYADGESVAKLAREIGMSRAGLYRRLKQKTLIPITTTEATLQRIIREELATPREIWLKPELLAMQESMRNSLLAEIKSLKARLAVAESSARLNFDTISGMNKARSENRDAGR